MGSLNRLCPLVASDHPSFSFSDQCVLPLSPALLVVSDEARNRLR